MDPGERVSTFPDGINGAAAAAGSGYWWERAILAWMANQRNQGRGTSRSALFDDRIAFL